jgi:hypothetical protein
MPIGEPFEVSTDESQTYPFVLALDGTRFLVIWSGVTQDSARLRSLTRARIFNSSGGAEGPARDIAGPTGSARYKRAGVLADGRIFVVGYEYPAGVYLKVLSSSGIPITEDILVAAGSEMRGAPFDVFTIARSGQISVFIKSAASFLYEPPFAYARAYDPAGTPLGELLSGDSVPALYGYQNAVEDLARASLPALELDLRAFPDQFSMSRFCKPEGTSLMETAWSIARYSEDPRSRQFAVRYCRVWADTCGLFTVHPTEHQACIDAGP